MSVEDIWNEPVVAPSRAHTPARTLRDEDEADPRPSKRRRPSRLFDPDSDDDGDAPAARDAAREAALVDAAFAELDDEDDPALRRQTLAPLQDVAALQRRADADARARRQASSPPPTAHEIRSSSPPPADDDPRGKTKTGRKKLPKLDKDRLLSKDGFPALIEQTRGFKPRGKGHEETDLNRLLQIYAFWAHKLFPRTPFTETVKTVERVCHARDMARELGAYKQAEEQRVQGLNPLPDDEAGEGYGEDEGDDVTREVPVPSSSPRGSSPVAGPSMPASAPASEPEFEDDDLDAALAEEEEMQRAAARLAPSKPAPAVDDGLAEMDDEEFWSEFAAGDSGPAPVPKPAPPQPPAKPLAAQVDEEDFAELDEEMAMLLDQANAAMAPNTSAAAHSVPASGAQAPPDDDYDDLYT